MEKDPTRAQTHAPTTESPWTLRPLFVLWEGEAFGSGPPVKTDRKIKVHSRAWKDSQRVRMGVRSRLVVVHHRRNSL